MSAAQNPAFDPRHGTIVTVAPGVRRLSAPNTGPYTFTGTNSYIIGSGNVAVVDPGPDDPGHLAALLDGLRGERIDRILLTHAHRDHSGGVRALAERTGAPVAAARAIRSGPEGPETGGAGDYRVDALIGDGARIAGPDWALVAVATPGHASDHVCLAVEGSDILLSGDHVMGWSTSVVAPPDGVMRDYMASLERVLARPEQRYLPGHGGPIVNGPERARGLRAHRRMREAAILDRLKAGDSSVGEIVAALYRDVDPRLHGAAAMSVLAHVMDLAERGIVTAEPTPDLSARLAIA